MKVDKRLYFIAPNWARKLEKIHSLSGLKRKYTSVDLADHVMKMNNYEACIVGEAYGFSMTYHHQNLGFTTNDKFCKVCDNFARSFSYDKNDTSATIIPQFESNITAFCNHVEKEHHKHFPKILTVV